MKHTKLLETTSFELHLLAMAFMLCDHFWGTIVPGNDWLTCIGRISFPIFAFMIVEGYYHTKNIKKYFLRLLCFAFLSEIPFDFVMGSSVFYPIHQNVLWSFLLSLLLICWNERVKTSVLWKRVLVAVVSILLGAVIGILTMVDFYHAGVLTVLAFYFFHGRKWWCYIGQLLCLVYINVELLGGLVYEFSLFGVDYAVHQQAFALLALIPIWLYKGKQGPYNKWLQFVYYAFYPAHLLILGILKMI